MSRGFAFAGVCLAGGCGMLIAYSTLRPELEKQRAEKGGDFAHTHEGADDNVLSRAIMSDLNEAKQQLKPTRTKGFAWGIREAIWGSPEKQSRAEPTTVQAPTRSAQDMAKSPQESIARAKVVDDKG